MKYDYGDEANFKQADENGNSISRMCTVVGITPVETDDQSRVFGYPPGTVLYSVEFGDGSDRLVPEDELESAK